MRSLICCSVVVAFSALLHAIEVPLEYQHNYDSETGSPKIASIKLADFDMLAEPTRTPAVSADFGTSNSKGVEINKTDFPVYGETKGKPYVWSTVRRGIGMFSDPNFMQKGARRDLYVLIEFFDDSSSGSVIQFGHISTANVTNIDQVAYGATNEWRKLQFHVTDAKWDRTYSSSDFWFMRNPASSFTAGGAMMPGKQTKPPSGIKSPQLVGLRPFYCQQKFGDKMRTMAVHRSSADAEFYDRLIFDANGNGDLTDDPAISGKVSKSSEGSFNTTFPAIDTTAEIGGKSLPYRFIPSISAYLSVTYVNGRRVVQPLKDLNDHGFQTELYASLRSGCHYRGSFELNGKHYTVALGDSECDGMFGKQMVLVSTSYSRQCAGDKFHLTSGTLLNGATEQVFSPVLSVDGNCYAVSLDESSKKLSITPITESVGVMKLPPSLTTLQLFEKASKKGVMVYAPPAEIKLPVGNYSFVNYTIVRQEENGDNWKLDASAVSATPFATVSSSTAIQTGNVLALGEPFSLRLENRQLITPQAPPPRQKGFFDSLFGSEEKSAPPVRMSKATVDLRMTMEGLGKEFVADIRHVSGNRTSFALSKQDSSRPLEPEYKVITTEGEFAGAGSFSYG